MTPIGGGISFIFSIIVLVLAWVLKGIKRLVGLAVREDYKGVGFDPALSVVTLLFVVASSTTIALGYGFLMASAGNGDNNMVVIRDLLYRCEAKPAEIKEKNVILRLDDVQAYGWTDLSIRMMKDAIEHDFPIVAGVIPKDIRTDRDITHFLTREHCHIELAMHGYDHGIGEYGGNSGEGEFASLNGAESLVRIQAGLRELERITSSRITTFIPPRNQLSEDARKVVIDFGMDIISSEGDGYFDYDASTWDFNVNEPTSAESVIEDCEGVFSEGKQVCVIMLHPQDFSSGNVVDQDRYEEYTELLDYLYEENISVLRFSDLRLLGSPGGEEPEIVLR